MEAGADVNDQDVSHTVIASNGFQKEDSVNMHQSFVFRSFLIDLLCFHWTTRKRKHDDLPGMKTLGIPSLAVKKFRFGTVSRHNTASCNELWLVFSGNLKEICKCYTQLILGCEWSVFVLHLWSTVCWCKEETRLFSAHSIKLKLPISASCDAHACCGNDILLVIITTAFQTKHLLSKA